MKMIQLKKTFLLLGCGWLAVSLAWSGTHLGAGGYLEWNGARVFPIGAYALPKGMNFTEAESVGFNLVHARADQAAWDQAGEAGLWVLSLLSLERFLIEFVRAKDDRILGSFTVAQAVAVGVLALCLFLIARLRRRPRPAP